MLNYEKADQVWKETRATLASPPQGVPLTAWPILSELVGGLRPHELTLLCAPTGAGKTQLLANLSAQFLKQRVPHFVAPVETGGADYMARVVSALDKRDYNTGDAVPVSALDASEFKNKSLWSETKMLISTYDNRVEIKEMIILLKYMHQEYGIKVALLDNLNFFLQVVSSQQEKAEMDGAIHEFVMLAKALPFHVILIVHPRKTDGGRVESEFDIKGSSTAVQEASNVLLFNRPTQEDVKNMTRKITDRELVFRKIRRRGTGVGRSVWLRFENGRLEEER